MDKAALNKIIQKYKSLKILGIIITLGGFCLFMFGSLSFSSWGFDLNSILGRSLIAFVLMIFGMYLYGQGKKKIKSEVGAVLAKEILSPYFEDLVYEHNGLIAKEEFKRVDLHLPYFDRIISGDKIEGRYKGKDIMLMDIRLTKRQNNGKNSTTVTVFSGPYIRLAMDNKVTDEVIVCQRGKLFDKGIELEDVEFNEYFNVYSQNEHAAFYILTPPVMAKIKDFDTAAGGDIYLNFHPDGYLYAAINNGLNAFEIQMGDKDADGIIEHFKEDLSQLLMIIDYLQEL